MMMPLVANRTTKQHFKMMFQNRESVLDVFKSSYQDGEDGLMEELGFVETNDENKVCYLGNAKCFRKQNLVKKFKTNNYSRTHCILFTK